nr:uncharacterized protein LOC127340362 [Lolium perenne]
MTNSTSAMSSRRERRPKPSPSPASASCRPASHRGQGVSPEHIVPSCIVLKVRPPPSLNPHLHHGRHTHPALGSTAGSPPRAARAPGHGRRRRRGRRPGEPPHLPPDSGSTTGRPALPERPLRGTARRAARAPGSGPGGPHRPSSPTAAPRPRTAAALTADSRARRPSSCPPPESALEQPSTLPKQPRARRRRSMPSSRCRPGELAPLRCGHLHSTLAPASTP